jgi:hypothetical protein
MNHVSLNCLDSAEEMNVAVMRTVLQSVAPSYGPLTCTTLKEGVSVLNDSVIAT